MFLGQPTTVVSLGYTALPEEIFMEMLKDMASKYNLKGYHLVKNNSNTFSDEVSQLVLGDNIPRQYAELPREFFSTGLG